MPVFVTGGTGFLGINLIRSLVQDGESVRALVRPTSSRVGLESSAIEFVEGDVTNLESLHRGIAGCSHVYHLAGWVQVTPWGLDEARRYLLENGVREISTLARKDGAIVRETVSIE